MSTAPKPTQYKTYRKFEVLIRDLRELIVNPMPDRLNRLAICAYQASQFNKEILEDPSKMEQLLETIYLLRASSGPGIVTAEKELTKSLYYLTLSCVGRLQPKIDDDNSGPPNKLHATAESEAIARNCLDQLVAFARNSFLFKRPRDSFAGERRAEAFAMLGMASRILNLSDVLDLAKKTLKDKKSGNDIRGAMEFMENYYTYHDDWDADELEKELKAFVSRTTSRSLAVGALDILINAGCISEFEALDRIDTWKESHR